MNPSAVIVAPTRELAIQIKDEARKFAFGSMVRAVVAYGGTSTGFQMRQLFSGCHVLIATPGRLMDFVEKGKVTFANVKYLVLDEADRILNMDFEKEVNQILANLPREGRRNMLFSATMTKKVAKLQGFNSTQNILAGKYIKILTWSCICGSV